MFFLLIRSVCLFLQYVVPGWFVLNEIIQLFFSGGYWEFEDTEDDYPAAETWQEENLEKIKAQAERKKTVVTP